MSLSPFLTQLFTDGIALVDPPAVAVPDDLRESGEILRAADARARADFPRPAPALNFAAALWGGETFHRACQLAVFRSTTVEMIDAAFAEKCPAGSAAELHYSVDLTWRYLPQLIRRVKHAASDDPLYQALLSAACDWPLSSVGIDGIVVQHLDPILQHDGLCREYIDRVTQRRDSSRLGEPRVLERVLATVGMHGSLIADWMRLWPAEITETSRRLAVEPK